MENWVKVEVETGGYREREENAENTRKEGLEGHREAICNGTDIREVYRLDY